MTTGILRVQIYKFLETSFFLTKKKHFKLGFTEDFAGDFKAIIQ